MHYNALKDDLGSASMAVSLVLVKKQPQPPTKYHVKTLNEKKITETGGT